MKPVHTIHLLNTLEDRVEAHISDAIKLFQNMPEAELLQLAANGGWSIAQCLEHLNSYGLYYLPQVQKGLDSGKGQSKGTFKSSWLGSYFTKLMEPSTGKKKIKAFKAHIPSPNLKGYEVVAAFILQQETLLELIKRAYNADLEGITIPISISKWIRMRLGDVLQFVIAHDERHIQQAKRNMH